MSFYESTFIVTECAYAFSFMGSIVIDPFRLFDVPLHDEAVAVQQEESIASSQSNWMLDDRELHKSQHR